MEDESGGSIQYSKGREFDLFHHRAFSYDERERIIRFNRNPLGEPVLVDISGIAPTEDGFSLLLSDRKRPLLFRDQSDIDRVLTRFLMGYRQFHLERSLDGCGFQLEYGADWIERLLFRRYVNGIGSDYLRLFVDNEQTIYLCEGTRTPVSRILLDGKSLSILGEGGVLCREYYVDIPDTLLSLLKEILLVGRFPGVTVDVG